MVYLFPQLVNYQLLGDWVVMTCQPVEANALLKDCHERHS